MKTKLILVTAISFMLLTQQCKQSSSPIKYPEANKIDSVDVYFGHEVADPYRWLEDDNSEETAAWVEAENIITQTYLSDIPFRDQLNERLTKIWNYPKYGVPFNKGDKYFFFKNDGIQNQSVLYMQNTPEAEPEVLLDPNALSEDGTVALASLGISKNGNYLAYGISRGGSDWSEIYVMDIETRETLSDHINWVKFSGISWKDDGFFYSAYSEPKDGDELSGQNQYHKVFYHTLGTTQEKDLLIFEDKENPLRNFHAYVTDDENFLIVGETESTSGNALYAAKLRSLKDIKLNKIAEGFDYDYHVIDNIDDNLLMLTNHEAPNQKLVVTKYDNADPANWKDIIPEKANVLETASLVGELIFVEYLQDASSKAYFYSIDGTLTRELDLPAIGTLSGFNGEKNKNTAYFGFTSFTFPSRVYKYNLSSGNTELMHTSDVDFEPENYVTKQISYTSKDGTKVPMFIVHKKDIMMDGNNPTMLYGYGGFNISLTPSFSISRVAFLEQGGIYVMANLRGGGEYGEVWHEAGTLQKKQNVFDDFISAANYLIDNKYTSSEKLAIIGGSNGGLLVGACMTQQPELFKVAIPIVGVMDMLRYHNFTIGWAWAADYGRSDDSEEMFKYLYGYSPLHNIKEGVDYPATLAITADHDDRVVPAHTFKFMATLQEHNSGKNPVLVRIETKAGHGAGKPTDKQISEATDMYSFIMYNLGMEPEF
ncbi:MAG: S9 family peptidase [Bacteroidetes bacterium]|nr:S9 family peptidase [Bacteroidota bacterium]MBL6943114.1 S9 family peptidase [Bacteroidales bacterium]